VRRSSASSSNEVVLDHESQPAAPAASVEKLRSITMLILTHDRPEFLLRLFRYLSDQLGDRPLVIAVHSSGTDQTRTAIEKGLERLKLSNHYSISHYPPEISIMEKMLAASRALQTEYVLLTADDDFYFFDWLEEAVDLLDSDTSYGTVYGNYFEFKLDRFEPYGRRLQFPTLGMENSYQPWLEHEAVLDRLEEIADPPDFQSVGWYALQRSSQLKAIIEIAAEFELVDLLPFEKYFNFAQAVFAKTKMVGSVCLARQVNTDFVRSPLGMRKNLDEVRKAKLASAAFLLRHASCESSAAEEIVSRVFANELRTMERNDARRHLRALANAFPILRRAWHTLRVAQPSPFAAPNPRLPSSPSLEACARSIEIVRKYVTTPGYPRL
jgi:glycosyltransferase domain-containing protein